jgi:hypothetical protein
MLLMQKKEGILLVEIVADFPQRKEEGANPGTALANFVLAFDHVT